MIGYIGYGRYDANKGVLQNIYKATKKVRYVKCDLRNNLVHLTLTY
jgi:hypothetical protein